ncbi:MAG: hypothetical protein N3F63_00770 [Thermoplasmata archaeon]|nr:hypothetical protein [Thermoplasmata archaeon]
MAEEVPLEGCNCINCRLARMELKLTEIEKEITKILDSEQTKEIATPNPPK